MSDFESANRPDQAKTNDKLELEKTRRAISEVLDHEFRFGFQYAFECDKVHLRWNSSKSLAINITPCRPEDNIWFGNCYDDAWVSSEYLKSKAGKGATITVQRITSNKLFGKITNIEHYRLLVEHHNYSDNDSVFTEIDHSPFYRKTVSGSRSSINSWVETDNVKEGERRISKQDSQNCLPMCEYEIDGREKILFFKFEVDEEEKVVYIIMQEIDSIGDEQKLDSLKYEIPFDQLDNLQVVLDDIEDNPAFQPDGPFKDQLHKVTLSHMQKGFSLIVAKIPPYQNQKQVNLKNSIHP